MKLESTQMCQDGGIKVVPRLLVYKLSYGPVEENLKTFFFWVGDDDWYVVCCSWLFLLGGSFGISVEMGAT